jgi:hypothetical protein
VKYGATFYSCHTAFDTCCCEVIKPIMVFINEENTIYMKKSPEIYLIILPFTNINIGLDTQFLKIS